MRVGVIEFVCEMTERVKEGRGEDRRGEEMREEVKVSK